MNKLIIVTGMSGSGKTTLAFKIAKSIEGSVVLSVDDFKVSVYKKYEFIDREENRMLNSLAKLQFKAELMKVTREGIETVIVEYPFKKEWNEFFISLASKYQYCRIVVNCTGASFDEVWDRKLRRDKSNEREGCLLADA